MNYKVITGKDRPDLIEISKDIINNAWPEFMFSAGCVIKYWNDIYKRYPQFQFVLVEPKSDKILAVGNSFPLAWEEDLEKLPSGGLDWALEKAHEDIRIGRKPTVQCAFQIIIAQDLLGMGLSSRVVELMSKIGKENGFNKLIAPVRPNKKSVYPLTPMESYIEWKNDDNLPFDAWLRVHARLKARIIKVCSKSMYIEGTVADWEKWTGMRFPQSGSYIIPKALVPVEFDIEKDKGVYIEPNVWMAHELA